VHLSLFVQKVTGGAHTACTLNKEVKYAEIEVEGDGKEQKVEDKEDRRTGKKIQINQPTGCNNFSSLLLDVYVQLDMFRASSRLSSGARQLQ